MKLGPLTPEHEEEMARSFEPIGRVVHLLILFAGLTLASLILLANGAF